MAQRFNSYKGVQQGYPKPVTRFRQRAIHSGPAATEVFEETNHRSPLR